MRNPLDPQALTPQEDPDDFDPVQDVREFHEKFDLTYDGPPREIPPEMGDLRDRQIAEEVRELLDAVDNASRLDARVDLVYFIIGTCYLQGWNFREAWRRVHAANLKKRRAKPDGSNSKRGSGFDVIKPEGWEHPDLSDLVNEDPAPIDWVKLTLELSEILNVVIVEDRPIMGYATLTAAIRFVFQPLLKRIRSGERTHALAAEIQTTITRFKDAK